MAVVEKGRQKVEREVRQCLLKTIAMEERQKVERF